MRSAVTVCLVPEARSGPFVFHGDLEVACASARELGFDAIELFPPGPDAVDAGTLRQILHRNRLHLAAVGTGAGWLVRKLTLTSPDPVVRRRAVEFVEATIDFAGPFGASAIIGSMQGRAEGETTPAQAVARLGEALDELGLRAEAHGVPLLVEPLNRYESNVLNTVEAALSLLGGLRTRNVRLLCDLFHMNIEEASIPDALRKAGSWVGHIHFADSNRRAIGFGHTEIGLIHAALRDIAYDGYLSAEILPLPSAEEAARQTIASFRSLIPDS